MGLLQLPPETLRTIISHLYSRNASVLQICPCLQLPHTRNGELCVCHLHGQCSQVKILPPAILFVCRQLYHETKAALPSRIPDAAEVCSLDCHEIFLKNCPLTYRQQISKLMFRPNIFWEWPPDSALSFVFFWNEIYDLQFDLRYVCRIGFEKPTVSWPPDSAMQISMHNAELPWEIPVSGPVASPQKQRAVAYWKDRRSTTKRTRVWSDYCR